MMIDLTEDLAVEPAKKQSPPWALILIAIGLAYAFYAWQSPSPEPQPDDQSVIVDDDRDRSPQPVPVNFKDSTLIFVLENVAPSAKQTEVMLSTSTEALNAKGMAGFRRYDEEQVAVKDLVDYAVSKNIPSPFVAIVRDKAVLKLSPFPESIQALEAFLR